MKTFDIIAKTQFGLEEILARELKELGASDIELLNRAVKYSGNKELLYKSNLHLRTALRILVPIASFQANDEQQLYDKIRDIDWSEYMDVDQTLAIDGTTHSEVFKHSKFIALKTKDAIVDQFRDRYGERPSIDVRDPDLRVNIHIYDRQCNVSIDSSGQHLDKRGYRLSRTEAPINEVLAIGIILLAGWDRESDFIDPMCGSGTFAIEAAMFASNMAPGRLRHFAFEKWKNFDASLWRKIKEEAESLIVPLKGKIIANDLERSVLEKAIQNAERAGVKDLISFKNGDFLRSESKSGKGLVVMNPPYGERMEQDDIVAFYQEIGTRLKHHFEGFDAWIISSHLEALKFIGLKTSRKIALYNGSLECKLHKYELYRGSKKE